MIASKRTIVPGQCGKIELQLSKKSHFNLLFIKNGVDFSGYESYSGKTFRLKIIKVRFSVLMMLKIMNSGNQRKRFLH